jgi:hypothetical protein
MLNLRIYFYSASFLRTLVEIIFENKSIYMKIIERIKNCKYRNKVLTTLGIILIIYLVLLANIKRMETLATFPGIAINVQDLVGHVKANPDFEEVNIQKSNGENINGLYLNKNAEKTVYYFHGN